MINLDWLEKTTALISRPAHTYWIAGLLARLAILSDAKLTVEAGIYHGFTTIIMALAAQEIGGMHIALEVREDRARRVRRIIRQLKLSEHCRVYTQRSIDAVPEEAKYGIGIFFHDSDHSLEYVRSEVGLYEPYIVPGGILAIHDTVAWQGTGDFIRDLARGGEWDIVELYGSEGLAICQKRHKPKKPEVTHKRK